MLIARQAALEVDSFLPVRTAADIEFLIKESEVVTGEPGRTFVIWGADRILYRIRWHPIGCQVKRLDDSGEPMSTVYLLHCELPAHVLGEALRAGQLFTPTVRH